MCKVQDAVLQADFVADDAQRKFEIRSCCCELLYATDAERRVKMSSESPAGV